MLVVINYCQKDALLVAKTLDLIVKLDGALKNHKCLLVTTIDTGGDVKSSLKEKASSIFGVCKQAEFRVSPHLTGRWPQVCNVMFQSAYKIVQQQFKEPFFWMEPDCVPVKSGWLDEIEAEYRAGGKPFMGAVYEWISKDTKLPHLTGCAVYPPTIERHNLHVLKATKIPWDVTAPHLTLPKTHRTTLIQHVWGDREKNIPPTFPDKHCLKIINDDAAVFHRCKDGTLQDRLMEREEGISISGVIKTIRSALSIHKTCVVAYLPPPGIGHTEIFLSHMKDYPPGCPVFYLSDHDWPGSIRIPSPSHLKSSDKIATFVFVHAIKIAKEKGFQKLIYIETDCRFGKRDWSADFSKALAQGKIGAGNMAVCNMWNATKEYKARFKELHGQHPFVPSGNNLSKSCILGQKYPGHDPVPFVNGAPAIYSIAELETLIGGQSVESLVESMPNQDRAIGEMAVQKYGQGALGKWCHTPAVMATAGETVYSYKTRLSVGSNGIVASHPIKTRWMPPGKDGYTFYHSGDIGDIIYALKAIDLIGGGRLVLGNENTCRYPCRSPMTKRVFDQIAPLLRRQKYLTSVEFSESEVLCSYNFNDFRIFWNQPNKLQPSTLCEIQCWFVGVHPLFTPSGWLVAGTKRIAPIVIHRSPRYRSSDFDWRKVVSMRPIDEIVFVGLPEEHKDFTKNFGFVPYYQPASIDDLAAVINGADLFCGNQSAPCAIALALDKPVYQETFYERSPDCVFDRPTFYNQRKPLCLK